MEKHTKIATFAIITAIGVLAFIGMQNAYAATDSMTIIKNQIVVNLQTNPNPNVQLENIRQAEHLIYGKPIILDTYTGVPLNPVQDTLDISNDFDMMVGEINIALETCAQSTCPDPNVASYAKELFDRNTYLLEIKENLEVNTALADIENQATYGQLNLGDEPQAVGQGITIGTDQIWNGWNREIRSPYFSITAYPNGFVQNENIIVPPGPIAVDECSVVVKEIQGIKSIMRPVQIPIWQEPWTSRANIIGYTTVWVIDFVPAEFVKTLSFCNNGNGIETTYNINVIIERELLHFWKYLPAGTP